MAELIHKDGFLEFWHIDNSESGKTMIVSVKNKNDVELGQVKWHGAWRKYDFHVSANIILDSICLRAIADFCDTVTKYHGRS